MVGVGVIRKTIFTTIMTFFLGITLCCAMEENIYVDKKIEDNIIVLNYMVGDIPINGLQADIVYNADNLSFISCEGNDNYEVSANEHKIIIESLNEHNHTLLASCKYEILNNTLINIDISNIKSSNAKVLDNYQNINLKEDVTPVEDVNSNENTKIGKRSPNKVIFIILSAVIIIIILFCLKRKSKYFLFILGLLIPLSIMADDNVLQNVNEDDVNHIRNYLLGKEIITVNELSVYDFDSDMQITINDLIHAKIKSNFPKIDYSDEKVITKGRYATEVIRNLNVFSLSDIVSLKYCITTKDSCTPKTDYPIDGNNVKMNIKFDNNKQKQKLCVEVSNKLGFKTNLCDSKSYLVDNTVPTLSIKKAKIYLDGDTSYNPLNNIRNYTFGVGDGLIECNDNGGLKNGTNKIKCTAKGNNGLEVSKQFEVIKSATYNKKAVFFGDSITKGAGSKSGNYSWANYIGDHFDLKEAINHGRSGWRISNTANNYINDIVLKEKGQYYDFVILHGGCNDVAVNIDLGRISSSYDPTTFDDTTFIGGLEKYLYTVVTQWPKAKIGYIINYRTPNNSARGVDKSSIYYKEMRKVLKKWNIAYIDLFDGKASNGNTYSELLSVYSNRYLPDTLHLNDEGYKIISPYIYKWMQNLSKWRDPR